MTGSFRAENSNTSRHLAEFWMIEPKIAFADLADNAALSEALLKYTLAALLEERQEDLAFFDQRIEKGLVAKLEGIDRADMVRAGEDLTCMRLWPAHVDEMKRTACASLTTTATARSRSR